jgi:NADH-quinone oxidoreductase subunit J
VSGALFLAVAALTIACALLVILHRSPVYSAIGLVGALGQIAILFLALDAQIVGFLQIIVYAGAIVVLFLFVIMLLNLQEEPEAFAPGSLVAVAVAGGVGLAICVTIGLARTPLSNAALKGPFGGTVPLAERLFTTYLLPFELTSVLLLVAIIGAVVLGKKRLP